MKKLLKFFLATSLLYPFLSWSNNVILFVWDGLRPDSVTLKNTPTLYRLMKNGVRFTDNHSSYPTFTMMNAATFATGDLAGKTGFYGNTLWHVGVKGTDANGKIFDFNQPAFTEDYKILLDLNEDSLLFARTLFQAAHEKGLKTAAIGKSGPAFLEDYLRQGIIVDEKQIWPLDFAKQLQQKGYSLPKLIPIAYDNNALSLSDHNGDPTVSDPIHYLQDGATIDASNRNGSPYARANEYMMGIYLNEILPKERPQLSVIWMRNPDSTEHNYGPGSPNYLAALAHNDRLLAQLENKLKQLKLLDSTDIIVVSDHGHSNVSGPLSEFPLRNITNGKTSGINNKNGYSVSGEIRTADLLTKAGFHAYDGEGCRYDPVLSGITANGKLLHATLVDKSGTICGKPGQLYTTPAYKVPSKQPTDEVIIAAYGNGGSEYFYVPSHSLNLVGHLVKFFQAHEIYGPIFVNTRYGLIDGTLPLKKVRIENDKRSPDIIVSFNYNERAKVRGLPGIEFSDSPNYRGMHGSFSPIDVHNFLAAEGPDFRKQAVDNLPTANIDVPPTIAAILHLNLSNTDGRVLSESLKDAQDQDNFKVTQLTITPAKPALDLQMLNALNQPMSKHTYTIELHSKILQDGNKTYPYFDFAKAIRK